MYPLFWHHKDVSCLSLLRSHGGISRPTLCCEYSKGAFSKSPTTARNRTSPCDTLLSRFALFALKDPSILAFEQRRQTGNLLTFYEITRAPSDPRLREILDPVDPNFLRLAFQTVFNELQRGKGLEPFVFHNGSYLAALDSTASNAPHIEELLTLKMHFILGAKPGDHAFLFDRWIQAHDSGQVTVITTKTEGGGEREISFTHDLPLNESHPELRINLLQVVETDADGITRRQFSWVTDLVDQVQQLCCPVFKAVLKKVGSKRLLWEQLR